MTQEFTFAPAVKTQRPARIGLSGVAGSGKTMSALLIGRGLVGEKGRIAVIDTEHRSASLYSKVTPFDTLNLTAPFSPARYTQAVKAAVAAGYDLLIIDSMSQEWNGEGGVLQMVEARKTQLRNDFAAWNGPSQEHEAWFEYLMSVPIHVIVTFQAKTEFAMSTDNGRTKIEKLGLAAITRDGADYRLDLFFDVHVDHKAVVTKTRLPEFADQVIVKPGIETGQRIAASLADGEALPQATPLSDEARTVVETLRLAAAAATDQKPYQLATSYLKAGGFTGWSDFFKRGANEDAAMLEQILRPVAETAETPELIPA